MEIVERALNNFKQDKAHWERIYQKAKEDLNFLSDEQFAQWDWTDASRRYDSGRPVLTIDQLSQFVHQVVNDIRMNTPSIGVIPAGDEASVETAEIYKGLIRNIEYISQADDAYDMGVDNAVRCSIGFIKIETDYENEISFNQELVIRRVVDPFSIYIDSNSIEIDGRDMKRACILEPWLVSDFKKKWPDKAPISFSDDTVKKEAKEGEYINLCKYYEIDEEERDIAMLEDGSIIDYSPGTTFKIRRTVIKRKIRCYIMTGQDVLEESLFPGKYIPIVPIYGEERWNKGERHLVSLIRPAKDSQRMFNYWKSLEVELLMKQPKAPIMVAEGQIEDYAEDWKNPDKSMALRYKTTDLQGNPLPAPQRLEPPMIPTGIINAAQSTVDDIKASLGMYNASIGQRSNEVSGVAIARRQEEGSVATYHFSDNLNKSIGQCGRILVNAIPEVYDSSRVIRIIDEEENPKEVGINGLMLHDQEVSYDLTKGKHDVRVQAGAPYTTRRQETVAAMTDLFARNPELFPILGDLYFKNSDFTGAQSMAKRMEKTMRPELLDDKEEELDPEKEQMKVALAENEQIIAIMKQKFLEIEQQLKDKQAEIIIKAQSEQNKNENDVIKNQIEERKAQIDAEKVINERIKIQNEYEYKMAELALKEEEIRRNSVVSEPMANEYY